MFLNPVISGFATYTELKDGSLNLYDVFIINELIEYKEDYEKLTQIEVERS